MPPWTWWLHGTWYCLLHCYSSGSVSSLRSYHKARYLIKYFHFLSSQFFHVISSCHQLLPNLISFSIYLSQCYCESFPFWCLTASFTLFITTHCYGDARQQIIPTSFLPTMIHWISLKWIKSFLWTLVSSLNWTWKSYHTFQIFIPLLAVFHLFLQAFYLNSNSTVSVVHIGLIL